ncbi:sensor histidine kinase [Enterococcus canintestini]|uniref:Sensor histidine kinase NatK-like C-terminal domain-containing protein n=1 Tax=Enterococcus canintestini TaxID=317010 RepID=A0A1L8R8I1_9ENTE|nr:GHKL domain-containing protein [Enterococcus canintestini]OJG16036.1 hypothetical protein RU96_GL001533 [Enterococcus canintestini]
MATLFELLLLGIEYFSIGFINGRMLERKFDKKYFLWSFVIIIMSVALFYSFGNISSVCFGILLLILSFNLEKDKFVAIITSTMSLGMYIFLNYVVGFALTKLNIYDRLNMVQILGTIITCYLIIGLVLSMKIKKFLLHLTQQKEVGWVLSILCILVLISYYALIIEESYLNVHSYYGLTNLFFVSMYTGVLIIGAFFSVGLIKQSIKNRLLKQEYQSLTEYMKMLELTNNEIRNFRHDYKNILLTIEGYLDEKDYSALDHYFRKVIMPTVTYLEKDSFKISKASNIESREVKSLVVNKVLIAQQKGINTIIEIPKLIKELPDNLIMLLIRALGIILDNAIEGADKSENPELRIAMFEVGRTLTIIIRNSCLENIPPLHQIKQSGFSTKGAGRGHGLAILQELIHEVDNVFLETKIENDYFMQKIVILSEMGRDDS